jgi:predicted nucleic acid-binding protein
VIVLDASALVALQDRRDRWYEVALETVRDEPGPFIVPLVALPEADALLAARSTGAMSHLLASVADGSLVVDAGDADLERIRSILDGAAQVAFATAAVVACAERLGAPVMTFAPSAYEALGEEVALVPGPAGTPVH